METSALPELPTSLFTAAQVKELESTAIKDQGVPGIQLMKRAGRAVFNRLIAQYAGDTKGGKQGLASPIEKMTIFCGSGNNAGDGYVIAALAAQRKIAVEVFQVGDAAKLSADARAAFEYAKSEGVAMSSWGKATVLESGLVVDALLGTGYAGGELKGNYTAAIQQINSSALPVVSVDLPSGLCADTGAAADVSVAASHTVTFIGIKRGLLTGRGPALCGTLHFDDLQLDQTSHDKLVSQFRRLSLAEVSKNLITRQADAHKGDFGHLMVIGGDKGMGGAPLMAVEAAARVGAGLVSVATRPEHVSAILARRPEAMVSGVPSGQALEPLLARPTVLVVGPGLGRSAWSEQMLQQALKTTLPMVLDADALNIISEGRLCPKGRRDNWILTPHPGEAARLLGCKTGEVQADRFAALEALQKRFGGVVVLKGAGSLVAGPEGVLSLSDAGNPGMASGGMGDVLSGILGGLLAQKLSCTSAAELGVSLHGAAADKVAAQSGPRGMLATDLVPAVQQLINQASLA